MTVGEFVAYCCNRHDIECNQKYAGMLPYSAHLGFVNDQKQKFAHLLQPGEEVFVTMACYGHDLIEDARVTYNDIVQKAGKTVADIIYCCTEEKGRNRAERHSDKFYYELSENRLAVFTKMCDLIANTNFSLLSNSSMHAKYKQEFPKMVRFCYQETYNEMFEFETFLLSFDTKKLLR